mmetsp:Transcript_79674/g.258194  ORF Transcript_79674/g.258194 Transcript_79674/m.258194 type:complete len:983 (-) Transcript_79674:93-3041(-)
MAGQASSPHESTAPLLGAADEPRRVASHKSLAGNEVFEVSGRWHYAMVFPRVIKKQDKKVPAKTLVRMLGDMFADDMIVSWQEKERDWWTKVKAEGCMMSELTDKVLHKVVDILEGTRCGFDIGWMVSVDEDEIILLIKLEKEDTIAKTADRMDLSMRTTINAYHFVGLRCLQTQPTLGKRLGITNFEPEDMPVYLEYMENWKESFEKMKHEALDKQGDYKALKALVQSEKYPVPAIVMIREEMDTAKANGKTQLYNDYKALFNEANAVEEQATQKNPKARVIRLYERTDQTLEGQGVDGPEDIQRAWYGNKGAEWNADQGFDVTEKVKALLKQKEKVQASSQKMGHDPAPGKAKVLLVELVSQGSEKLAMEDGEQKFEARMKRWAEFKLDDLKKATLYEDFKEVDILRMMDDRMARFINVGAMMEHGLLTSYFPLHTPSALEPLKERWGSLKPQAILQWPGEQHDTKVREYFGEEVAFFFTWLNSLNLALILPSAFSLIFLLRWQLLTLANVRILEVAFSLGMCCWLAYFTASYVQFSSNQSLQWGMNVFSKNVRELPGWTAEAEDSVKVSFIRAMHWVVVFLFIAEAGCFAACDSTFRAILKGIEKDQYDAQGQDKNSGLEASDLHIIGMVSKYSVTINIKLSVFLWGILSPKFASMECRRTEQEKKDSQVLKNFVVMSFVYYYPFIYLAFVMPHVEKCVPVDRNMDGTFETNSCIESIKSNLLLTFIIHLGTVVGMMCFEIARKWWAERSERRRLEKSGRSSNKYTDVEDESKRQAYEGDTAYYLELMIQLGLVAMFSSILPSVALIALASNLIEARVSAWKLIQVCRRPAPVGQEGIGAWVYVMQFLCCLSAVTSVGLVIFVKEPCKSEWGLADSYKCTMFIIAEHLMLMVVFFVASLTPPISGHTTLIMRQHTIARAKLLGSVRRHIDVQKGTIGPFASDQSVSEGGWEEFPSVFVPPELVPQTFAASVHPHHQQSP